MKAFATVIIPVYKVREDYLRRCLDSLCSQTFPDFRVILIDDGSPDRCGAICDEYAEKDSRFFVIHQENKGVSEARNAGIRSADTEWILFADADDWTDPDLTATLYEESRRCSADIYIYDYYNEFPEKSVRKKLKQNGGLLDEKWKKQLKVAPFHFLKVDGKRLVYACNGVWNKMFRASLIRENKLAFEKEARRGEDSLFLCQALQCADRIDYVDAALYHYRRHRESLTNVYNSEISSEYEYIFHRKEDTIQKYGLPYEYQEALYASICTRMYSILRLSCFNRNNPEDRRTVRKEILEMLDRDPYKTAFQKVKYQDLASEQKVFVFLLKHRMLRTVQLLVNLRKYLKGLG